MEMWGQLRVFCGTSNPELGLEIVAKLGIPLGKILLKRFSDKENRVQIEENVRDKDVFIIQPTCTTPNSSVDENLMQLLVMIHTCKRSSARRITAVIPYLGYSRQDQKEKPRVPITAKLVADLVKIAGADRVMFMDLHSGQTQGFFDIPTDNLYFGPTMIDYIKSTFPEEFLQNAVVVSPDAGGTKRARYYAKRLGLKLCIIDKRRDTPNQVEEMNILGDVSGKNLIIVDDMVDTAGTLTKAVSELKKRGAKQIICIATHPVLSGSALENISHSAIDTLFVSNSIPLPKENPKIQVVSAAELFAEAIQIIHTSGELTPLFQLL